MTRQRSGVRPRLPDGVSQWAVLGFAPEYGTEHPLWNVTGLADLDALALPAQLTERLRRWSAYWDSHNSWDSTWPPGHPEAWWLEEETQLPQDVATALGYECAVAVPGGYLHSRAPAAAPAAAAQMRTYVEQRTQIGAWTAKARNRKPNAR